MKKRLKQFFSWKDSGLNSNSSIEGLQVSLDELILLQDHAQGLNFLNQKRVMTDRVGGYLSRIKGRGIDFEEVRVYQPGDDIRLMDWRVTARTSRPHTKIFHEERERPVFILVDLGPHMFFGTKVAFKSVVAAKIAALIAWAAVKNGDRIGGIIYGGENCHELRPKSRQLGILPFLKALSEATQTFPVKVGTHLEQALLKMRNVVKPGSLIFIISDFSELTETCGKHLGLLSKHNQVVTNFIYDQMEKTPPPANHYSVSDGNNCASIDTSNPEFCRLYRQNFEERLSRIKEITNRHRIVLINIKTSDVIIKVLKKNLCKNM